MKLKLINKLKQNVILILSILVILSPIFYINRQIVSNSILWVTDKVNPPAPGTIPWLHTAGNQILTADNNPIILRGVNISSNNWNPQYKTWHPLAVEKAVTNWHVNIIRTRVFEENFVSNPLRFFKDLETEIIIPARKHGIYVVLHPWLKDNSSLPTKDTQKMWTSIAQRYKNDPTVIYDVLGEPRDIPFSDLETAYKNLIPAIRVVNPKSLIMVTGLDWGRDINEWQKSPLPYSNLVYRANPYNKQGEIEGYILQMVDTYPVFFGEFGRSEALTSTKADIDYLLQLSNTFNIGWTAWNFSAEGCPCLLSDESSFTPSDLGNQVFEALQGRYIGLKSLPSSLQLTTTDRYYIYADFLDNGFTDYSWNILRDLVNQEKVSEGKRSIKVNFFSGGGIFLHSSREIPIQNYKNLTFDLSANDISSFFLRLRTSKDDMGPTLTLSKYATKTDSSWYRITIPLLDIPLKTFSSIMIESTTNNTNFHPTIYLDNIFLE